MDTQSSFACTDSEEDAEAFIDFSAAIALKHNVEVAIKQGKPLVIGTTGLSQEDLNTIESAAHMIPLFYSANFSLGIALCMETLRLLKNNLPADTEIALEETHHCSKKDAPSGTALLLAQPLSLQPDQITSHRPEETLFIHEMKLAFGAETITLKHESFSRDVYASGALRATEFILNKPSGLYTMEDLLYEKA